MKENRLCLCELSGEYHVVSFEPRTCCELCNEYQTEPLTTEVLNDAFQYLHKEISRLQSLVSWMNEPICY